METERFEMRAPMDWLAAIDEWRQSQPIPPSRAAAIRYLVDVALKAGEATHSAKPESPSGTDTGSKPSADTAKPARSTRARPAPKASLVNKEA